MVTRCNMKISESTIERLVHYHSVASQLMKEGQEFVSSREIADALDIKDSQVRKDLSYFGDFGRRGVGYEARKLCEYIDKILGTPHVWKVALAGVGHLGTALIGHSDFYSGKFFVEAAFDVDPNKIGTDYYGIPCYSDDRMPEIMREKKIEILILAVPESAAQSCVDIACSSETLRGVLSFASSAVSVPKGIMFHRVDILAAMEKMFFFLKDKAK